MIIETCPKCGHDLIDVMLASNPPIPKKECWSCGWSWIGEPEEVKRIPFGGNKLVNESLVGESKGYTLLNVTSFNSKDTLVGGFEQSACVNCQNNPKNGGSGICHCTLGQIQIT